jgi:hypothetical protein
MGRVISMDGWLERRERPHAEAEPDDVARLERAVARLEPLLAKDVGLEPGAALETELLAVSGAVSLGLYDEAARRAEQLASRLTSRRRQGG